MTTPAAAFAEKLAADLAAADVEEALAELPEGNTDSVQWGAIFERDSDGLTREVRLRRIDSDGPAWVIRPARDHRGLMLTALITQEMQ